MTLNFINVGYGNMVAGSKVVAILHPNSAPVKKITQDAKEQGLLLNAAQGRKVRSVIITESNHVILSSIQPETIVNRLNLKVGLNSLAPSEREEESIDEDDNE